MREGWKYKKLNDVCQIARGGSPRPINEYITDKPNGINWIKIGDAVDGDKYIRSTKEKIKPEGMSKSRFVHRGDFILSNSMSFGRPYILDIDGCIHDGWLVLHDTNNLYIKDFLYYLLSSPWMYAEFKTLAVGGVVNNLNSKLVGNVMVPIPSIDIQQSIVSELDEINNLLSLKRKELETYDKLAQSLFCEMFGDPVENEMGWEVKKLGDIAFYPNKRIQMSVISAQEYVGVENLIKNRGGVQFSEKSPNADTATEFQTDDILIGNIRPYLKKIWKADKYGGASGDVIIIRIADTFKEKLYPLYLYKTLSTDTFFDYNNANTHGAKMPRGDKKAIAKYSIPLPPLPLQQLFAQRIEAIEEQKVHVKAAIEKLETLFAARMQYWFD